MAQVPMVPPAERTRILIADDDRLFAEMLRSALAAHDGFEVVAVVENGERAVAGAGELKPSLVLMDVAMPVLDGIEATRQIRDLPDPPAVVLITGEESEGIDRSAYEAGASVYLRKSQDVVAVIDVVVAVSQMSTALI
jgi:two-component system, NarL family, response regulator NreC